MKPVLIIPLLSACFLSTGCRRLKLVHIGPPRKPPEYFQQQRVDEFYTAVRSLDEAYKAASMHNRKRNADQVLMAAARTVFRSQQAREHIERVQRISADWKGPMRNYAVEAMKYWEERRDEIETKRLEMARLKRKWLPKIDPKYSGVVYGHVWRASVSDPGVPVDILKELQIRENAAKHLGASFDRPRVHEHYKEEQTEEQIRIFGSLRDSRSLYFVLLESEWLAGQAPDSQEEEITKVLKRIRNLIHPRLKKAEGLKNSQRYKSRPGTFVDFHRRMMEGALEVMKSVTWKLTVIDK